MKPLAAAILLACAGAASAQTVSMGGSLGSNALLVIDGKPKTVAVGATVDGVRLLSVTGNEAVVEVKGKRVTVRLGDAQVNLGGKATEGAGKQIVLIAQGGGHFYAPARSTARPSASSSTPARRWCRSTSTKPTVLASTGSKANGA
jgi:hypothetical protein